ncbi:winged helix-turn-helix domain-containing protein [Bremerella sp. T1]
MGFSCQKPTRQAKEQDPQAIVEWQAKECHE